MFRFLTFPPFCYVKIRQKTILPASSLHGFILFLLKKFDIPVRKYVYFMYQVSSISKLLTLISFRTDNFGGKIRGFLLLFLLLYSAGLFSVDGLEERVSSLCG